MAKKTKADLETEVRQLKEKARFWENIAGGHQETIDGLKESIKEQRYSYDALVDQRDNILEALRAEEKKVDKLEGKLHARGAHIEDLQTEIDRLKEESAGWQLESESLRGQLVEAVNGYDRVVAENKELKESEDEKRRVIKELTDIANKESRAKLEARDYSQALEDKWNEHLKVTEDMIETVKTLERDACEVEIDQMKQVVDDAEKQISEWRTATEHQCKTIDQLQGQLMEKVDMIEELDAVVDNTNNELNGYIQKLNEVQNELQIKETSLQYIENGLRSAEQEVLTLRQTNRNLLNYLNIIASQDNPNIPKDFNF